ncbi:MAG: prepilin-type cleavage/methylation domain-containing protein, partial [Eubacteriales bacterium]
PCTGELTTEDGEITAPGFIPQFISKLDSTVTQQKEKNGKNGFGVDQIGDGGTYPDPKNIIMIYLTSDGSSAEVKVFSNDLNEILWSSVD